MFINIYRFSLPITYYLYISNLQKSSTSAAPSFAKYSWLCALLPTVLQETSVTNATLHFQEQLSLLTYMFGWRWKGDFSLYVQPCCSLQLTNPHCSEKAPREVIYTNLICKCLLAPLHSNKLLFRFKLFMSFKGKYVQKDVGKCSHGTQPDNCTVVRYPLPQIPVLLLHVF